MTHVCNETRPSCNESACLLCGVSLEVRSTGRPRLFCSSAHRVRYDRLRQRSDNARPGDASAAVPAPPSLAPPRHSRAERIEALSELADTLEDFRPSGRVAELRRLSEYAEDVRLVLDTIETNAWVLDDLAHVAYALESLQEHRKTLDRLSELDDLASDVETLARDFRDAGRLQEDLHWAITEFEE